MQGMRIKGRNGDAHSVRMCRVLTEKHLEIWFEGGNKEMYWDFEFNPRKTESARRPDLVLEDGEERMIYVVGMACPS